MLKTRDWRGIPFMTGALTDILLSLEDCLDRRVPAFIRVLDAETLTHRLRQDERAQQESAALINGRLSASLIAYFSNSAVKSVDRDFLMYVLLNLAGDNGERVLVLTDNLDGSLGSFKRNQGKNTEQVAAALHYSDSDCLKTIITAVYRTNAAIVLSDIVTKKDYELYESVAWQTGRPLLWIQLPGSAAFDKTSSIPGSDGANNARAISLRPTKWRTRMNLAYHILQTQLKLS